MRRVYLIRHAEPEFPNGERCCIGLTDLPLGTYGRLQACILGREMKKLRPKAVFCSFLSRSRETASFIKYEPAEIKGLEEMFAGDWDGLSFSQIREGWPELFAARGGSYIPPPNSEDNHAAAVRLDAALRKCLQLSEGDIAVVSHNSLIQTFLTELMPDSPPRYRVRMPYVSYVRLDFDGNFHTDGEHIVPRPEPDRILCYELLTAAGAGDRITRHCGAVAEKADRLAAELIACGVELDRDTLRNAAILHDIARRQPDHPQLAAKWLSGLGYPREAEIVSLHHDYTSYEINEAAVLFIADKLVIEDRDVTLEERFDRSLMKCGTPEAVSANNRRRAAALALKDRINNITGKETVI